jgi:hypothetical protein
LCHKSGISVSILEKQIGIFLHPPEQCDVVPEKFWMDAMRLGRIGGKWRRVGVCLQTLREMNVPSRLENPDRLLGMIGGSLHEVVPFLT